ncbi:MAG TPA: hypothetical protein VKW70_02960, partial [Terriglobia bacterium]|nr:hypothetical protein [Terriglobia bacterium]
AQPGYQPVSTPENYGLLGGVWRTRLSGLAKLQAKKVFPILRYALSEGRFCFQHRMILFITMSFQGSFQSTSMVTT